ncbi:MAG TPA: DUF2007 domain-containing protein [Longimicrobium sp.]|nr:DUF2007 domain-containing protein [Longimicrobium sp.]
MSDDLVVVRTFMEDVSAHIARSALEASGIDSIILRDDAGGMEIGLTFSNQIRLVVRREDAEEALRVLDEIEETAGPEDESES